MLKNAAVQSNCNTVRTTAYCYVHVQVQVVQLYGTEHQLDDDLSIYRICTYKYDSYWYEYKYRTAVSTVFSMCTVTVRAGDQVRIDAFLRRYLAFRSILQ